MTIGNAQSGPVQLRLDTTCGDDVPQKDFRDAMASLAASVCVVTARSGSERLGRTVTAAMSLGIDPPAILVSINAGSDLATMIRASGGFSIAILSEFQQDVADAFAGKQGVEHRFGYGDWKDWPSGHPRLDGAVAALDCAVIGEMDVADHILFAGGPREIDLDDTQTPLVWHHRRYNSVCTL
ncbi:MAG: flavin reductase family protein [Magnetospiraceae bacterium]